MTDARQFDSSAGPRIASLVPGQSFAGAVFVALDVALKNGNSGAPYLALRLRDCTGTVRAILWGPSATILQELEGAKLVKVRGTVDASARFRGDFKLTHIEAHPEPADGDLTAFLTPLSKDHRAHKSRFFDLIRSVENAHCARCSARFSMGKANCGRVSRPRPPPEPCTTRIAADFWNTAAKSL